IAVECEKNAALFDRLPCKRRRLRSDRPILSRDRRGSHPCQSAVEALTFSSQCRREIAKQRRFPYLSGAPDGRLIQDYPMTSHNVLPHSPPHKRPIGYAAIAAVLFTVLAASGCSKDSSSEAPASASDPVVARVNGVDIRQSDLA